MADQPKDVFDSNVKAETPPNGSEAPPVDKYADLLKSIKNEDGVQKYDSVEKAIEALSHSQAFIPQLKSQLTEREKELERIKNDLEQRESVEQVVQRLIANNHKDEGNPPTPSGLDEQAVTRLVQQTLQQTEQTRAVAENRKLVQESLRVKFGEKAGEAVAAKAVELGTTPEALGELASKSPNVVLALFNSTGNKAPSTTTTSVHLPPGPLKRTELKPPEKSILSGATSREQREFLQRVREEVYAKHGVES